MSFKFDDAPIPGSKLIRTAIWTDERGSFAETWREDEFCEAGVTERFVQDNRSVSSFGVLRGIHFQMGRNGQSKLVAPATGAVFDVVVDLRPASPMFGQAWWCELDAGRGDMLFIPNGCAHAFLALSREVVLTYSCSSIYAPAAERGIRWDDPELAIPWPIPRERLTISKKDAALPHLRTVIAEIAMAEGEAGSYASEWKGIR